MGKTKFLATLGREGRRLAGECRAAVRPVPSLCLSIYPSWEHILPGRMTTLPSSALPASGPPRSIVLLFGWLGCSHAELTEYAELYTAAGAAAVWTYAERAHVVIRRRAKLLATGLDALHAALKLLEGAPERTPLCLHCFSHGGAFVWEAMRDAMAQVTAGTFEGETHDADALRTLQACIRAEIFDSAPCFNHVAAGVQAIRDAVSIPPVRWLAQASFLAVVGAKSFVSDTAEGYWTHWARGAAAPGCAQLYIYSALDTSCDIVKLEELIALRKASSPPTEAERLRSADPWPVAAETAQEALLEACKENEADGVRAALGNGAAVNQAIERGNTPLHVAAMHGATRAVAALVQAGANLQARNIATAAGCTAADCARRCGEPRLAALLERLAGGEGVDLVDISDDENAQSDEEEDGPVSVLHFKDTFHVGHLRKHPSEYANACLAVCGLTLLT